MRFLRRIGLQLKNHHKTASKKKKGDKGAVRDLRKKVKEPSASHLIPQNIPYLLIGGGTASFSALRSIKSKDPKAKVLVITEEDLPYMRPPLSKELWYNNDNNSHAQLNFKQWNGSQRSLFYEPREFYAKDISALVESDKGGVALATGWKVVKIDAVNKIVTLDDGYEIQYEKCLIATGANPKTLPLFEQAPDEVKQKVLTFRTKEDFLELNHNINQPDVQNVVIIGGGFLGSELACSLARNFGEKKNIYQIFKEKYIMSQVLPEYLSEWTTSKAKEEGVRCIPNAEVKDYVYKNGQLSLVLTGDQQVKADQVIVAVGVEANTDLAKPSYLEIHPSIGGYLVNAELEARSNLWVAGDAACFYDVRLGRRRVEHHDHAVISGRLAGENMTGASKPYTHQSMFWSDLGPDIGYEAVGIIDSSLPTIGVFAQPSTDNEQDSHTNKTNEKEVNKVSITDVTIKENNENTHSDKTHQEISKEKQDDFGKGVIFYLRDNTVIGIVLWNIFNRMSIARQVLAVGTKYEDLNEVAKLFSIHED